MVLFTSCPKQWYMSRLNEFFVPDAGQSIQFTIALFHLVFDKRLPVSHLFIRSFVPEQNL